MSGYKNQENVTYYHRCQQCKNNGYFFLSQLYFFCGCRIFIFKDIEITAENIETALNEIFKNYQAPGLYHESL